MSVLQSALQDIMPIYETLFTYMIHWKEKQVHKLFHQDDVSLTFNKYLTLVLNRFIPCAKLIDIKMF